MMTKQTMIKGSFPQHAPAQSPRLASRLWNLPTDVLVRLIETLMLYQRRFEGRMRLEHLDGRMLDDIGMTPEQRDAEVVKPFWRR